MRKCDIVELYKERAIRRARKDLLSFTKLTFPSFIPSEFHNNYYTILNQFAEKKIKNLMVTVPPQHGKSEGSTRRLPSYIFGLDPDRKIAIASYNTPFARKFNRDIQRIIDTKEYREIFPDTRINGKNVATVQAYLRNADEFEIVEKRGSLKSVGRGGALTGNPVDTLIIDDLYKDYMEGNSPVTQEAAWDWYMTVARTRLHNDSQQLIVFTRWNENDLIGKIENKYKTIELDRVLDKYDDDVWYKINYEAIKTTKKTELDSRDIGVALWADRHSIKKLESDKASDIEHFECLYQGNPQPREGYLYRPFKTYEIKPELKSIECYVDVADTGSDYLCAIVYGVCLKGDVYIIDVLYTQDAMEITEPQVAQLIDNNNVQVAHIESNSGGRGFSRNVDKLKTSRCIIKPFHQSSNKESRIYTNHATVNSFLMPIGWVSRWEDFYTALRLYKKMFKANKHDDAPDAITGVCEKVFGVKRSTINKNVGRLF